MSALKDFVALDWIKGEIVQTLAQARQALETVARSPEEASSMRSCLTWLHQVHGTLRMLELDGAIQLSGEMEELAQALMSSEVPDVDKAQEALMQAILQMPNYLDRIRHEQKELPGATTPIINKLRLARGEGRLGGDTAASGPGEALTRPPVAEVIVAFNNANGSDSARKLRVRYQKALLALLRRTNPRENLRVMGKVFNLLTRLCGESPKGNLFQLALAVIEGISAGAIKFDSAMAKSLRAIDEEIKSLTERGDAALSEPVSQELGRSLFDAVSAAARGTPRMVAARHKFSPTLAGGAAEAEVVSLGPGDETLAAVAQILQDELTGITDKLDVYARSANPASGDLVDLIPKLEQIRGTMLVVGMTDHQASVSHEIDTIQALAQSGDAADEEVLLNMAKTFLRIEAALKVVAGNSEGGEGSLSDLSSAEARVVAETRRTLAQVKDAIIEYVTGKFDKQKIGDLPAVLKALHGGLVISNQQRCADVLLACAAYVEGVLLPEEYAPESSEMDDLADAITSVDYYLERYIENPREPYLQTVELAEAAITRLGYAPGESPTEETMPESLEAPVTDDAESSADAEASAIDTDRATEEAEPESGAEVTQEAVSEDDTRADSEEVEPNEAFEIGETPRQYPESRDEPASSEQNELDAIFLVEANEKLTVARDYVANPVITGDLVAAFHTLKGSAGMAEVQSVARIAAPMEKLAVRHLEIGAAHDETFSALVARSIGLMDGILLDLSAGRESYAGVDEFCEAVEAELAALDESASGPAFDFDSIRLLLEPEPILAAWDEAQVGLLTDELKAVVAQAERVDEKDLKTLAEALLDVYRRLTGPPAQAVIATLTNGHAQLVAMFDEIAADQDVTAAPHIVEALRDLDVTADSLAIVADGAELPADEIDEDVLPLFLEEAEELSENMDQNILDWSKTPNEHEQLENLLRHLHTLKGGARLAGLSSLGQYAHNFETYLIEVQKNPVEPNDAFFALLNERQDEIVRRVDIYARLAAGQATAEELSSMRSAEGPAVRTLTDEPAQPPQPEIVPPIALSEPPEIPVEVQPPVDDVDVDTLMIFLEEADELVEAIDQSILDWISDPKATEPLDDLLRQLHTLKGGARMAGIASLGEYTHNFETFLTSLREHPVMLGEAYFALVNERQDEISRRIGICKKLARGEASGEELESMRVPVDLGPMLVPDSTQVATAIGVEPVPVPAPRTTQTTQAHQEMVRVASDLLEELISLAGESSITRGRVEQQIADFGESLQEMEETIERIREQVRRLEIETESRETMFRSREKDENDSGFDELEMDRYTMLQELSRALSEGSSDMLDLKDTLVNKSRDAETLLHQQSRVINELQEGLMRTRMVPFTRLVPRLRRTVRQISGEVGKSVRFDAYNVEGELDRNVLERIVAPLEHMLRNAVDHGIESLETRRSAGKPEQGRISLRLSREGSSVVLTVSDDGGGINIDSVRAKAVERGLMTEDSPLSDQDVRQFIMHAGFSTAEKVTQISGRGVGMDVVNSEIKQLGGSISIDSIQGVGTEFTIRLPFTVSINRALMVVVQDETYAVPLNTIEGIYRVSPYELEAYYQPDAPMFEAAGQPYRLVYLGRLLDDSVEPDFESQLVPLPVILARSGDKAVAFQVDRVIGSREVVVKSLGAQFNEVPGLSGATVMGDGSVVVILDVMALVRGADFRAAKGQPADAAAPENHVRTIMIVDDSVTVRKVTSRLMERQGWDVMTAKDGVDAMTQLQDACPDVVLLDIEMPRMDGFEVLRSVRRDARMKNLPIIMITSRTGEKHKQRALQLGVNRYLGKPFQEANLLDTIEEVLAEAKVSSD